MSRRRRREEGSPEMTGGPSRSEVGARERKAEGARAGRGSQGRGAAGRGSRAREAAEWAPRLLAQTAFLVGVVVVTTLVAELAGAANLGVALGIGQIAFAIALVALLLTR